MPVLSRYLRPDVLSQLASSRFQPRDLVSGNLAGAHKSSRSGFAVEFTGHRLYTPGDDPKHIDWRVYFTRDRFVVKQYELETNLVCHFVLDISASMQYGDEHQQKLLFAAQLATTLAYFIIGQSDKVSLFTWDNRIRGWLRPSNSFDQIVRFTEHLERTEAIASTELGECLAQVAGRLGRREIVVLISDFLADLSNLEDAIQRFRFNDHEVVLLQVLHPDELIFPLDRMTRFVGLEREGQLFAHPDDVRQAYLESLAQHNQQLESIAERHRCERVLLDTGSSLGQALLDYLNQRKTGTRQR